MIVVLWFAIVSADARLYDKEKDLIARYGTPSTTTNDLGDVSYSFSHAGFVIISTIPHGRNKTMTEVHIKKGLLEDDINDILKDNAEGQTWRLTGSSLGKVWERTDYKATAVTDDPPMSLTLSDKEYAMKVSAEKKHKPSQPHVH